MSGMKYIIADPDEQSSSDLKRILDGYKALVFQGSFITIEATENSMGGEPPDIAFIRMDKAELNANKFAGLLRGLNPFTQVVFISSYESYAVEAFECEADGFLLLPFNEEQIMRLLLRSIKKRRAS